MLALITSTRLLEILTCAAIFRAQRSWQGRYGRTMGPAVGTLAMAPGTHGALWPYGLTLGIRHKAHLWVHRTESSCNCR